MGEASITARLRIEGRITALALSSINALAFLKVKRWEALRGNGRGVGGTKSQMIAVGMSVVITRIVILYSIHISEGWTVESHRPGHPHLIPDL